MIERLEQQTLANAVWSFYKKGNSKGPTIVILVVMMGRWELPTLTSMVILQQVLQVAPRFAPIQFFSILRDPGIIERGYIWNSGSIPVKTCSVFFLYLYGSRFRFQLDLFRHILLGRGNDSKLWTRGLVPKISLNRRPVATVPWNDMAMNMAIFPWIRLTSTCKRRSHSAKIRAGRNRLCCIKRIL